MKLLHLVLYPCICSSVSCSMVFGNLNRICVLLLCENVFFFFWKRFWFNQHFDPTRWCHCLSCGWESGSLGCLACPQQTGRHRDIRGGQAGKSPQVGRKKRLSPSLQAGGTGAWLLGEWLMCKLGLAGRSRPLAGCPSMACSQEHVTLEGRTKSGASLQVIQTGCRRG